MRNFESFIARMLLIGYLITVAVPALPAESLSYLSSGKIKKDCKRSYAVSPSNQDMPIQAALSSAERTIKEVPQAAMLSLCGSASTYLPARAESELLLILQQAKAYPAFPFTQYTILFQELDPDPPKFSIC